MASVRRIVLDVLKPHDPELAEFSTQIADMAAVDAVSVAVIEIDREVQNVKLTVEGESLDYDPIRDLVEDLGATVHSVDEVASGEYLVEPGAAPAASRSPWLR